MKKIFRFYNAYERTRGCQVEAETYEEAYEKAKNEEWYDEDGGEEFLVLEQWKCIEAQDDLSEDEIDDMFCDEDWECTYDAHHDDRM